MKEERHTSIEDLLKFQTDYHIDTISFKKIYPSNGQDEFLMEIKKGGYGCGAKIPLYALNEPKFDWLEKTLIQIIGQFAWKSLKEMKKQ